MKRAAIYVRISSDKAGQGLGVRRQEEDCRRLAELRGWRVVEVYEDNDISAYKKRTRPAYQRMLKAVHDGELDVVLAYNIDRLTRRMADLSHLIETTGERLVPIVTVSGDLDTSTASGRMVTNILGSVAQAEVERLRERVMRKQDELADAGKPGNGGRNRPYGYGPDRMTVVEDEAEIIREIASRILKGDSLGGIGTDLERRGIPTPNGAKQWYRTTIRGVVTGPRVAGLRVHRGAIHGDAAWPAILDRETWEAVRTVLKSRAKDLPPSTNARRYLLSGLVVCGVCGESVRGQHHGTRKRYACNARHAGRMVEHLDEFVIAAVLERLSDPRLGKRRKTGTATSTLAARLDTLRIKREELVSSFGEDDALTLADLRRLVADLDRRIAEARSALEAATSEDVARLGPMTREDFDGLSLARRRAIIAALFEPIVLHPATKLGRGFDPSGIELRPRA